MKFTGYLQRHGYTSIIRRAINARQFPGTQQIVLVSGAQRLKWKADKSRRHLTLDGTAPPGQRHQHLCGTNN